MYKIREAKDEDRDSVIRLLWKAHDVTSDLEETRKEHWAKGWHSPKKKDWSYVALEVKEVVANVSFFEDRENVIRGRSIPFSAVWGVATLPQHRRKGLIRELFVESFKSMREKGISLSILAPFYKTYYEKFGYSVAEHRVKHEFPRILLRLVKGDERITNREMSDTSEAKTVLEMERSMSRYGSRNFHTISTLERMIKENHFHLFERDNAPVGTVKFYFNKVKEDVLDLGVYVTTYTSLDIFPSIVELVGHYASNATTVRWYCDPEIPVRYYMDDLIEWSTIDWGGMMMRVVDLEEYSAAIQIPDQATESVILKLNDEMCPWNEGTFKLLPNSGSLEIERLRDSTEPDVSVNALGLSEIIGGLNPATVLRGLNKIDCTTKVADNLESIFPADSFVSYQRF
ncbi:MAG: GNAT family N-acetyltransferase [Candidatus Thorarchaeota archaeon]|jgi:predicted acetyltransferase